MGKIGINMSGLLKKLSFRTGQSRKITYYRPPIYDKDDYGVETASSSTNEILIPNVRAYIRNIVDKNYVVERGGHNITGKARIYLPNLTTLKNYPNFNQDNNDLFNDITGFDTLIDYDRTVYQVPTSTATGWIYDGDVGTQPTSDGEKVTAFFDGPVSSVSLEYSGSASNILECDRLTFQVAASGTDSIGLRRFEVYTSSGSNYMKNSDYLVRYDNVDLTLPQLPNTPEYLTVDVPIYPIKDVVDDGTSIYLSGTRYGVTVTSGSGFNNIQKFTNLQFVVSGTDDGTFYIKNVKFYKSTNWSVQKVNDYNDEYMVFDCVRTSGVRDKLRRAYGTDYNTP